MIIYYLRSGQRTSRARLERSKENAAIAYETGKHPDHGLRFTPNKRLADRIRTMPLHEFLNWSGVATWRDTIKK